MQGRLAMGKSGESHPAEGREWGEKTQQQHKPSHNKRSKIRLLKQKLQGWKGEGGREIAGRNKIDSSNLT